MLQILSCNSHKEIVANNLLSKNMLSLFYAKNQSHKTIAFLFSITAVFAIEQKLNRILKNLQILMQRRG